MTTDALRATLAHLAAELRCDPAPFEPLLDLASAPTPDGGPACDLLLPGSALGLNAFDRAPVHSAPTVQPLLARWCADQLGCDWLTGPGATALAGLRVHGGPAFKQGAWRCKLYASGADALPAAWDRLHRVHGLGAPTPPPGTYALGLDLTEAGPTRLRSYRRVTAVPPESGLPPLPLLADHGVVHRVWCATEPGPADPDTRSKGSLSWIFGPRVPTRSLLHVAAALARATGIPSGLPPSRLAAVEALLHAHGALAHAVAWEIDTWPDGAPDTDGLITVTAPFPGAPRSP